MQPTRQSPQSQGSGRFHLMDFRHLGNNVVIEPGVLVFHPENIEIGDDVYIGHNAILQCDAQGILRIGSGTRIGPQCLLHGAGEISIGEDAGIGAGARILASCQERPRDASGASEGSPVVIEGSAQIGAGATILQGTTIGSGAFIQAGSVVTQDVPELAVACGVPAQVTGSKKSEAA